MNQDNKDYINITSITSRKYHKETGELISEYSYEKDSRDELAAKDVAKKSEHKIVGVFKMDSRFTKLYHRVMPEFSCRAYLGHFTVLNHHLAPELNYVASLSKDKGWIPLTKAEVQDKLGLSKSAMYFFMKECTEKNIIRYMKYDDGREHLIINPIYAFNGRNLNMFLYDVFKNDEAFNKALTPETKALAEELASNPEQLQHSYL